jgi:hypothetical protein
VGASGAPLPPPVVPPAADGVLRHLARYQLLWLATLFILVSGGLLALALLALRAQEIGSSQRTLDAFTQVIEEMTTRTLQIAHLRLEQSGREIEQLEAGPDATAVQALLRRHLREMPFANAMWLLDANGKVIAGTDDQGRGADSSAREYFQALRNAPQDRLVIGKPAVGGAEKRWRIPMAHTLHDTRGQFQGVVWRASIRPTSLRHGPRSIWGRTMWWRCSGATVP